MKRHYVDAGQPRVATLPEFDADSAAEFGGDRLGHSDCPIVGHPGARIIGLGPAVWCTVRDLGGWLVLVTLLIALSDPEGLIDKTGQRDQLGTHAAPALARWISRAVALIGRPSPD